MRVLVVAPQPFFTPRGTPFSVYYRTLVMAEQGARIDLLSYGEGADVELPGVRLLRIPRIPGLGDIPVGPSWKKLVLDALMVLWTTKLLLRERYAAVHAHEEAVFWCRWLRPLFGFKLLYDAHSSLPQQLENFSFTQWRPLLALCRALEDSCLRAADAVITICPALAAHALARGTPPERHVMIENSLFEEVRLCVPALPAAAGGAAAAAAPALGPGRARILYAGTFEIYQGLELLLEAFALLRAEQPEVELLLLGGRPEQVRTLRARADALGLGEAAQLPGQLSKREVLRAAQAASVLVSPRVRGTNTPLKIYEQLASGVPLVATRIPSHTQVLDDSVCFLVEPDARAFAAGLARALREPEEAGRRALAARERYARHYSRPIYAGKLARALELVR